jgi:parallel beta-helix repeat protein
MKMQNQNSNYQEEGNSPIEEETENGSLLVVINEIAWMGTTANATDEWIELYNNASSSINLTGWTILKDDEEWITFSTSSIPAEGYFLLERSDDETIKDISADNIFKGALTDDGHKIELIDSNNNLIDKINFSDNWPAGKISNRQTMERINSLLSGSDPENWASNNQITRNGKDADDNSLNGTPKEKNSVSKLFTELSSKIINENTTFTYLGSPYIITGFINISPGIKITFEPEVEIQFHEKSGFNIEGEFLATNNTFTSFNEDQYWDWLYFKPGSNGKLENVIIEKGGKLPCPGFDPTCTFNTNTEAIIRIEEAEVELIDSIIRYSDTIGVWAKNATTTINNDQFLNNSNDSYTIGPATSAINLEGENSFATIENSTFQDNKIGIYLASSFNFSIKNNDFINNDIPIETNSLKGNFLNNIIENNELNGILVNSFGFTENINEIEIQPDLDYIIQGQLDILSEKTLNIAAGTTIKFYKERGAINVYGDLKANGEPSKKITFTTYGSTWDFISFSASSTNSFLDNVVISYGGFLGKRGGVNVHHGAIKIEGLDFTIKNSLIENNAIGIELINADFSTSTKEIFVKNNTIGIYVEGEYPENLSEIIFEENKNYDICP